MSQMPGTCGRRVGDVVRVACGPADEPAGEAAHELVLGHLHVEHAGRRFAAALGEHAVERPGLVDVAGVAVEHEAARGVRLRDALGEHADRHVVRHERAAVEM